MFLGWQRPAPGVLFADAVRAVAASATHSPAVVDGYVARLGAATAFLAVAYLIAVSLVVRARPARRAVMLTHAALFVAMSVPSTRC